MTPEQLLARFRHMLVSSGVAPHDATIAQLLDKVKGETDAEKLKNLEEFLTLVPEEYWQAHNL